MQERIQNARAVSPEESEGVLERTELNMLTRTRRVVRRTPQCVGHPDAQAKNIKILFETKVVKNLNALIVFNNLFSKRNFDVL